MTGHDIYLLSPEISLAGVGLLVMALDLLGARKDWLFFIAFVGLALPVALGVVLWDDVHSGGALTGVFGSISIDKFALFFKFLTLGVVGLVVLASYDYIRRMERLKGEFLGLIFFSATGMMLLASATELITLYVSLELSTLPIIAMAAFLQTDRSSESGIKYLVLSGISSALLLYGMVLVWGFAGSTYLGDIAQAVAAPGDPDIPFGSYALLVGVILIVAGFGFKISSAPFQMWVPDVYEGAPTPVVAFLSVASKAAGFAILLRVFYTAFPALELDWALLFAVLATISMTLGNLVAMTQSNIKRLLAYSTIAHAGYILVGLAAVSARAADGVSAGPDSLLFYLGVYAATNLAAFFAIIALTNRTGSDRIDDLAGMGSRAPVPAMVLAIALISLIGVPPTGVFIGKLFLFSAAVDADLAWLAVAGVVNSVLSAYYYLRVIRVMYMTEPAPVQGWAPYPETTSPSLKLALAISGAAVVVLGVAPRLLTWVTDVAAGPLRP
jgi:NADH-quinone oxidoreductase subunit N